MSNARKQRSKLERWCAWVAHDRKCAVMGIFISLDQMELDHIIPVAVGGLDDWPNLIPVHAKVNRAKSHHRYDKETQSRLEIKADKALPALRCLLERTTSIPKEDAMKIDLYKIESSELLADLGPTNTWTMNDIKVLVTFYLRYGVSYLESLAKKLKRTVQSLRSKLASIGIYDPEFEGQK